MPDTTHATLPHVADGPAFAQGDCPYADRMARAMSEAQRAVLQVELLKVQHWLQDTGQRVVLLFGGRDAGGGGGTIKRLSEHLNPRSVRAVTRNKPTEQDCGQWFFQRSIKHLPTAGRIVLNDRSGYNRAGVARVMDVCAPNAYLEPMRQTPECARMLTRSGARLFKYWFSVTRDEQRRRVQSRETDSLKHWKLSPIDRTSLDTWDDDTDAKAVMFFYTDSADAPSTVIRSNDKKRAQPTCMRHFLAAMDYPTQDLTVATPVDPLLVQQAGKDVHAADHVLAHALHPKARKS